VCSSDLDSWRQARVIRMSDFDGGSGLIEWPALTYSPDVLDQDVLHLRGLGEAPPDLPGQFDGDRDLAPEDAAWGYPEQGPFDPAA